MEGAAGLSAFFGGHLLHLGHDLVALGMGQHHVHAEAGHQADDALGHGEGLAVAGRIGPGHGDLLALQVLHAAELVDDVQHVGHALGGVVDVALQVDQGRLLLQHPVLWPWVTASTTSCMYLLPLPMYMSSGCR